MGRSGRKIVCLVAVALLLAGCATSPAHAPLPQAAAATMGRLVAVRAVVAGAWSSSVLSALGTQAAGAPAAMVECIVLTDDGRTLSVMQPAAGALHPGLRVALVTTGQAAAATRITAAGP